MLCINLGKQIFSKSLKVCWAASEFSKFKSYTVKFGILSEIFQTLYKPKVCIYKGTQIFKIEFVYSNWQTRKQDFLKFNYKDLNNILHFFWQKTIIFYKVKVRNNEAHKKWQATLVAK